MQYLIYTIEYDTKGITKHEGVTKNVMFYNEN